MHLSHFSRRILLAAPVILFGGGGCFFDADLPLKNNVPVCTNPPIVRNLVFPDSMVCTLSVEDKNDSIVAIEAVLCPEADIRSVCDTNVRVPWPGNTVLLQSGFGTKKMQLLLDTNRMGYYNGFLVLTDAYTSAGSLPFIISRIFLDPFDGYPLDPAWWHPYATGGTTHIGFDYVDRKIVFSFDKNSVGGTGVPGSTGIRTVFSLPSDFYATVDVKLRDEMDDAFEVGFFISTSTDTGRWSGDRAGIYISGSGGRLRFECRSVDLQSYSFETNVTGGELGIRRAASTISYFFHDGNPAVIPVALTSQTFNRDVPVYLHLKMSVQNSVRNRNCYWNDFCIPEGQIRF
jgi:hypothetical protein